MSLKGQQLQCASPIPSRQQQSLVNMPPHPSSSDSPVPVDAIPRRRRKRSKLKGALNRIANAVLRKVQKPHHVPASNPVMQDAQITKLPNLSLDLPQSDWMVPFPTPLITHKASLEIAFHKRDVAKNASSPINDLPPEILTEIFAIACFSEVQPTNTARRERTTPLILIKVCGRWRQIVLSTPHLWSWVLIRLYKSRYTSQLALIEDWLGRTSDSQPLTIELSFEDESAWVDQPPHELVNMLLVHSDRWRSIDLTLPEACYQGIKSSGATFPSLDNIALQPLLADAHVAQSDRKPLDVFDAIPKLTHLRLNGYYLDDCAIPWSQLQELVLQHVYVDECFYALERASNLVSCTLSTMLLNDYNRSLTKCDLHLPRLETLRMQGASGKDQALLIQHITAPSLTEFYLASHDADISFPDIPQMVSRSGCLLRTLELNGTDMVESKLIDLLRDLPSLETFRLNPNRSHLSNAFLEALCDNAPPSSPSPPTASTPGDSTSATPMPSPNPFLPNLRCLEYDGGVKFDEEVLVRMIKLRTEQDRVGAGARSAAFLRRLEVLKLCDPKAFGTECRGRLTALGGR